MNNTLFETFEIWLQGRINTCVMGLFDRVSRLEELRVDDQITGLRMENDALTRKVLELHKRLVELEDRRVEAAPDQGLSSFEDRVRDCFDSEDFRDSVRSVVFDYLDNRDDLVSMSDVEAFIENNVRIKVY